MKNIIVIGDSFCACNGWPNILANKLNLKLIQHGFSGHGWWIVRKTLKQLPAEVKENCEVIVFVHTSSARFLSSFDHLTNTNWRNPSTEIGTAAHLYFKYIYDNEFHSWAQNMWFSEINKDWKNQKVIHLFGFDPDDDNINILINGVCILPTLMSISLNEVDSEDIANDSRLNHLNKYNNEILAEQLFEFVKNYKQGKMNLDTSKFKLLTTRWFEE
jgi:hypothetical protein